MAKTYSWPNGTSGHSIPWDQHVANVKAANDQKWLELGQASLVQPAPVAPAASAPSSPDPASLVMPQQYDPTAELAKLQSALNIGLGDSEATYQRQQTAYGLGYNQDGTLNTLNPYSQAQLLQDNYHRSLTGTTNSYASQGQLYSGAYGRAQARNDRLYAQGSSSLQDQARNAYHQIGYGQLQNQASNVTGIDQTAFNALRKNVYGG